MTTGYTIQQQDQLYFLTFQVVDWVDVFTRPEYRDIILDSFEYAIEHKGFQLFAYVIMSNHVHLIAHSSESKLSNTIRDIKKHTSKQIIDTIKNIEESRREWMLGLFRKAATKHTKNKEYQVWTHENHAIWLYSPNFIAEKIQYIHDNPVKALWVQNPEDYLYSSARNYAGLSAFIDVEVLTLPVVTVK